MVHPRMKLIILLLLGHALPALAMPDNEITLKLDNKLSSATTESVSSLMLISPITPPFVPADKAILPVSTLRPPSVQTASGKQDHSVSFKLKLSGELIDESRIGKISTEERGLLQAWQKKLLDSDNRKTGILPMQNQVKQLQDGSRVIQMQSAKLDGSPATTPSPAPSSTTISPSEPIPLPAPLATAGTQENRPISTSFAKQPVVQQNALDQQSEIFAALGLASVILVLWFGLPYYAKIRSRFEIKSQQRAEPIIKPADDLAIAPKMAISPVAKPRPQPGSQPLLQDMENFLADFDPKRYGSVSEFLTSRNAITPEQLIGWSKYRPASRHFALRVVGVPTPQM